MVVVMQCEVSFPDKSIMLRKVNSVKIERSWRTLTNTATIKLARNVSDFDKQKIKEVFQIGDRVNIKLGYNEQLTEEFIGYITKVSASVPIVIELEDEMWKLKRLPVNVSLKSTSLKSLLSRIAPGYNVEAMEVSLGKVRFAKTTVAKVLDKLKSEFGLTSYYQNNTLYCGKVYDRNRRKVKYVIDGKRVNVISAKKLIYKVADDVKIKIKATSIFSGKKIHVEVGDSDGVVNELSYHGIETEIELKKLAQADLEKLKVDGFEGSVYTFGDPFIEPADIAEIYSAQYPERNGAYLVDSVTSVWDATPKFHRTVGISRKV